MRWLAPCLVPALSGVLRADSRFVCSPHILHAIERIAIDLAPIAEEELDALTEQHLAALQRVHRESGARLTWFEVMTGLAYKHFAAQQVLLIACKGLRASCSPTRTPAALHPTVVWPVAKELPSSVWVFCSLGSACGLNPDCAGAQADCAVVEAGLGGELDATNVTQPDTVALSVITPIGLEHEDVLGALCLHAVHCLVKESH